MKTTNLGEGVTQLSFFSSWFPINCCLVEEVDSVTLIDAAIPPLASGLLQAIRRTGKPLGHIVLTHAHNDHIGAVGALKSAFPEARIVISSRDARILAGDVSLEPHEAQTPIKGGIPKKPPFVQDVTFEEGARIGSLQAVATPGHTPGHFAFWHEASGTAIAGDAMSTRGGLSVAGRMRPSFPFPAWATWSAETSIASARKLLAMTPKALVVGHGPSLHKPAAAIIRAIEEAEAALTRRNKR
ncbi:MBL fold metallo-hydrolase [Cohnella faecalis]|uniref:MBL fold metallo-hydrolase n=1 Tax=Cohnella faecalis TaxID=2315694 RepID=A0A398CKY5_9BACL|nr:MBL fold metallo-hydrolase [Cohnella faecalis]RIE03055.1 MBL fold metallo-hydrolase [Cohnella faecalis]